MRFGLSRQRRDVTEPGSLDRDIHALIGDLGHVDRDVGAVCGLSRRGHRDGATDGQKGGRDESEDSSLPRPAAVVPRPKRGECCLSHVFS